MDLNHLQTLLTACLSEGADSKALDDYLAECQTRLYRVELARLDTALALERAQHQALKNRLSATRQFLDEKIAGSDGIAREMAQFALSIVKRCSDG